MSIAISLLLGFFLATTLATILGQTGDWGILAGSILTACMETLSNIIYSPYNSSNDVWIATKIKLLNLLNSVKIGILYGLFVDAFKLGS
uniref:Uncharacterized protein ycf20 n=1 Tax=Gronococcus sybilensis TaxID=3028029 RepID=A0A9Y1MX50_9RHOD|nr:hypothetical protein GRSY_050 [Gronococcus sybilensis]